MPRSREELERAAADAETWLDGLDPEAITAPDADAYDLRRLGRALSTEAEAQRELAAAVAAARTNGRTWGQIAMVLGVSKQAARQRYGQDDDPPPSGRRHSRSTVTGRFERTAQRHQQGKETEQQ